MEGGGREGRYAFESSVTVLGNSAAMIRRPVATELRSYSMKAMRTYSVF